MEIPLHSDLLKDGSFDKELSDNPRVIYNSIQYVMSNYEQNMLIMQHNCKFTTSTILQVELIMSITIRD